MSEDYEKMKVVRNINITAQCTIASTKFVMCSGIVNFAYYGN